MINNNAANKAQSNQQQFNSYNNGTEAGAPPADDKQNSNVVTQPLTNIDPTGL